MALDPLNSSLQEISINSDSKYGKIKSIINRNQVSFFTWNFGTINIRSGKEKSEGSKLYMVAKEAARANLLICCLQEVKYRNDGKKLITLDSGENIYSFGVVKRRDGRQG